MIQYQKTQFKHYTQELQTLKKNLKSKFKNLTSHKTKM